MMNFKKKSLVVLMLVSILLLSSCEVYNTLYAAPAKEPPKTSKGLIRIEGEDAKDPSYLAKMIYASSSPVEHDPFKTGEKPLGPFPGGNSLGITLETWLHASGIGIYAVKDGNAELDLSFKNLVPKSTYTVWCSRMKLPPNPSIKDEPCGESDGSENVFQTDDKGTGTFSLKFMPLEPSTNETASVVAIAYHSDGKTYGASPGDFGLNSHVQLFFLLPEMAI